MNEKMLNALTSAIYVSKLSLNGQAVTEDDQKIRASGLYPEWAAGNHMKGEIYNTHAADSLDPEWEQTWECYQAYDNSTYPEIVPGNAAWYTFNRPLHGKTLETARPFVPVQGAHDMYRSGEYMIFTDGKTYLCKQDTNFSPTDYSQAWEVCGENEEPGTEPEPTPEQPSEYPEWVRPTGGHDAYNTGDRVTYNGTVYESKIDGNAWSPDEYPTGWEVVA